MEVFYLKVIQLITGLAATILGVLGNTINNNKLTSKGYWALLLAVITFAISFFIEDLGHKKEVRTDFVSDSTNSANQALNNAHTKSILDTIQITIRQERTIQQASKLQLDSLRSLSQSQQRLYRKNLELARLSRETLYSVTGGDSYCYIYFKASSPKEARIIIENPGQYTVYGVNAVMYDLRTVFKLNAYEYPKEVRDAIRDNEGIPFSIGDVPATDTSSLNDSYRTLSFRVPTEGVNSFGFTIHFVGKNFKWYEIVKAYRKNAQSPFLCALRVTRRKIVNGKAKEVLLMEKVDPGFPRDDMGRVSWYW